MVVVRRAWDVRAISLEAMLAVELLCVRHPLLGTTCGLLRNDSVLKHPTDIHRRRQVTDYVFELLAAIVKQPSSNMCISILVYIILCRIVKISWWAVVSFSFYLCEEGDAG